jgi:hypothetical protein
VDQDRPAALVSMVSVQEEGVDMTPNYHGGGRAHEYTTPGVNSMGRYVTVVDFNSFRSIPHANS